MRVGLNATCLNDRPSGARQRFLGIYGALFKRLPDVEFVIYEPHDCRLTQWFGGLPNVSARVTPVPSMGRFSKLKSGFSYWRQAFALESFDLFEAMHLPLFYTPDGKTVLTIHDVRGLHADNSLFHRTLFGTVLYQALRRADHVVTVSSAMREEILKFYPHKPISVVYNGLDAELFASVSQSECEAFLYKYNLPRHFVLAVGHFEHRKNYFRLIESMALLKGRGCDYPLVIVGNDSGEGVKLEKLITKLNLTKRVTLLTGLTDLEVRCAYLVCGLFVFPSSYEGFGIPILEAMASNCPMAISNLPVFEEITQGQSLYFPFDDLEAMANAIEIGISSTESREKMINYGMLRLNDFSFDRLAEDLVGIYEKIG